MIVVKVRDRDIKAAPMGPVTSGSVGLPVRWEFSEEWAGLTKTAVFRGSNTARDVFLTTDECTVPAEVLTAGDGPLEIGVRGVQITHDEDTDEDVLTVVIPTIWGRIERIFDGTIPSQVDPSVQEPDWTDQVKAAAAEALSKATAAAPFYAEFGVTTKAEIETAINDKRQIYAYRNSGLLKPMLPYIGETRYGSTYPDDIGYVFALTVGTTQTIYSLTDQWTIQEINLNAPAQRAEEAAEHAEEVLASIPADYTELTEDVDDLEQTTTATTIGPVALATFNASAANMPLKGLTVNIEPVQAGSGDPSPDNVRPITGWTGVNVFDDPKYAFPINWNQIRTDTAQSRTVDGITTQYDPQTHLFTITNNSRTTNFGSGSTQCVVSDVDPVPGHRYALLGSYYPGVCVSAVNDNNTLRTTANVGSIMTMNASTATMFRLRITSSYDFVSAHPVGDVYSFYLNIVDITQLLGEEAAETATYDQIAEMFPNDWYPYNAGEITCVSAVNSDPYRKISVNWQNEAGTVYGGTFDVVNRELHSCPYYSSYNGETLIGPWISSMDVYSEGTSPTIGAQVVDMGGLVTTYYLTDVTDFSTILGTNNIFADCGDVTVTYGAYLETVKGYADIVGNNILSAIAPLEVSYTASRAYTAGSYLFVGTKFYKVTTAIASGDTINPGTNVVQTTVAEQLMTLAGN